MLAFRKGLRKVKGQAQEKCLAKGKALAKAVKALRPSPMFGPKCSKVQGKDRKFLAKKSWSQCRAKIMRLLSCTAVESPDLAEADSVTTIPILTNEPELDSIWGNLRSLSETNLERLAMEDAPSDIEIESAHVLRYAEGANNRVVIIQYEPTKTKRCIRIPACGWGDNWIETDKLMIERSARMMQYLKTHTAMPIPGIIHHDVELTNIIGAPYMIMEHIEGQKPLELWWGNMYYQEDTDDRDAGGDSDKGDSRVDCEEVDFQSGFHYKKASVELEQKRQNILKPLAFCMAELRHLKFDKLGTLSLSSIHDTPTVEPTILEAFGQVERDEDYFRKGPTQEPTFQSSRAWLESCLKRCRDEIRSLHFATNGITKEQAETLKGIFKLYALMIECIPLPPTEEPETFVIAPPDFGSQNILVDNNGNVTAILDWDRVQTLPRCAGWIMPPDWLFHDWFGPDSYSWPNQNMTLDEYAKYRKDYTQDLREARGDDSNDLK